MSTASAPERLSLQTLLAYATGSLGAGVYSTVPSVLLLYYMTQVLVLPVALASLAVLLPKVVIMAVEPMVGAWSDRVRARQGTRRPFLIAGAILGAVTFVILFNTPRMETDLRTFLLVAGAYLSASLGFSFFAVPYVAMPAELSAHAGERAKIVGFRMAFVFAGVLLGAAAPPILVERFGGGSAGYGRMAVVIASISLACMLVSVRSTQRGRTSEQTARPARSWEIFGVLRYRPFTSALIAYGLIMIATAAVSAAAPYFVTYVLAAPQSDLAPMFITQILTAIATMAIWAWLTARLRFSWTLVLALICQVAGASLLTRAQAGESTLDHLPAFVLMGAGSAGVQVAAFALLADVTSGYGEAEGSRHDGLMTGIWTASEKVALALGPAAITGAVLSLGGFVSAAPRSAEPASALEAARYAISVAPAAVFAFAAVFVLLARRTIDRDKGAAKLAPPPTETEHVIG